MKKYSYLILPFLLAACSSATSTTNQHTPEQQQARAIMLQGVELYKQQSYTQAMPLLQQATEQGDMKASRYIGLMYLNGEGVTKSPSKAFAAFTTAANRGDITSQYWLGYLYENGIGVEKDLTTAVQWYKKSAARGDHVSQPAMDALKRLNLTK
ncbi:tetratricopeptide repeat protein [Lonepinella sp. BR2357]|uniref:tetratricopeptide repeat protein n=1 Tax=Lonepinella sp. BR2357 TaxID=3434549 RepID=UPI003F6DB716